jgi:anthranilate synthase component II
MILVIDNYDSFTYNLVHYLNELGGETLVRRNDALSVQEALGLKPEAVLLSPGPCTPDEAGICLPLLRGAPEDLPILGVCLGHQAIGAAFSGKIVRAQQLMHGKTSVITTTRDGIFAGLPEKFTVNRYHSLAIEKSSCPADLVTTAWTDDGEIMGVRHKDMAIQGVQFHPESILTEHGHAMLKNFLEHT